MESLQNLHKPTTTNPKKSNISTSERKALKHLEKDGTIIIIEGDKGEATVIMGKTGCRNKIFELLSDAENYTQLQRYEDDTITQKIEKLIKEYEHDLTQQEKDYITKFSWKT